MIDRRAFLGLTSLALISSDLFAQDPKPKTSAKAKGKTKATPKSKSGADDSRAPLEPDEQINRILGQARTDGRRLPGIIGGIVRGEELAQVGAVGIRKIGSADPIRCDDLIHLGSCTKAMTATIIGTLVDEGKLRWNSTIREVFPEWASAIHPDFQPVTLNHLLSHRAGFSHDLPWWQADESLSVIEQRRNLMAKGLQNPPEAKPGSKYSYSNTGFVLAGMMAEQVTQTPWEDLMRGRLFGPLGMTTAGFGPPGTQGKVDHAWGHRASGDTVVAVHHDNAPAMGPAGTVHCSIRDWARFASLHLTGSVGGTTLLKPETMKALHTPRPGEEYVGGWLVIGRSAAVPILTHNGSNTYWYCTIWLDTARQLGLLVATNAAGKPSENACDQAIKGLNQYVAMNDRNRRR